MQDFVEAAGKAFEQQLTEGQVNGPRLLLRFFAALTHASVLMPEDVLSLMGQLMEVAQQHTAAGVERGLLCWLVTGSQTVLQPTPSWAPSRANANMPRAATMPNAYSTILSFDTRSWSPCALVCMCRCRPQWLHLAALDGPAGVCSAGRPGVGRRQAGSRRAGACTRAGGSG